MKIGVDCDGTFRDILSKLCDVYKQEYPDHVTLPVTEWELEKFFPIGKEIYKFAFQDFAKEIFLNAPPYPHAIKALRDLRKKGHTIHILTYQNQYTSFWTAYWLHVHGIPYDELRMWINDTSKHGSGKESTYYDLYVDDCDFNIERLVQNGKVVVRMERPWNSPVPKEFGHVTNLKEFINIVDYYEDCLREQYEDH